MRRSEQQERMRLRREQGQKAAGYTARGEAAETQYADYLSKFDASKGLNEWATGAYASVSEGLGKTLERLAGESVGAGRFNTGLFDQDAGEVVRATQRDFSTALTGRALDAQSQQLGAMGMLGDYGVGQSDRGTDLFMSRREELENAGRDEAERKRAGKYGIAQGIGTLLGAAGGFVAGGPYGAMTGARIGGTIFGGR